MLARTTVFMFLLALGTATAQQALPRTDQMIVCIPDEWNSKTAPLQAYERDASGAWKPLFNNPVRVQLGRSGVGWGRGILAKPHSINLAAKREGDGRAPAGMFRIGQVLGYTPTIPGGSRYPYNEVNQFDAWVDDVRNPYYNQHVELKPGEKAPPWFESQRMRLGDGAYKWMIEIRHNMDPKAVPGAGSAIFFHIRRGATRYTSGCTALKESDLLKLIGWLKQEKNPHYVLLPASAYEKVKTDWRLPQW